MVPVSLVGVARVGLYFRNFQEGSHTSNVLDGPALITLLTTAQD